MFCGICVEDKFYFAPATFLSEARSSSCARDGDNNAQIPFYFYTLVFVA